MQNLFPHARSTPLIFLYTAKCTIKALWKDTQTSSESLLSPQTTLRSSVSYHHACAHLGPYHLTGMGLRRSPARNAGAASLAASSSVARTWRGRLASRATESCGSRSVHGQEWVGMGLSLHLSGLKNP